MDGGVGEREVAMVGRVVVGLGAERSFPQQFSSHVGWNLGELGSR